MAAIGPRVISLNSLHILQARGEGILQQNGCRVVSSATYSSLDSQATVEIPDQLESAQTFRFLDFSLTRSESLFHEYIAYKGESPTRATVIDVALEHIQSVPVDTSGEQDSEWIDLYQRIGMSSNFIDRVMGDDSFKSMRLSGTAKHWAIMAVEERFHFLLNLDKLIQHTASGNDTSSLVDYQRGGGRLLYQPRIPARGSSSEHGKNKSVDSSSGSSAIPVSAEPPSKGLPGHTILLKGGALERLKKVNTAKGALDFGALASTPPGDFSSIRMAGGLYLIKEAAVAGEYARWAEKFIDGNVVPIGILTVAIPDEILSDVFDNFGEDWQRFVFTNRKNDMVDEDLQHVYTHDWIRGPICTIANRKFELDKVAGPHELKAWKNEQGNKASQYWTCNMGIFIKLNQSCSGKVWINLLQAANTARSSGK